MCMQAHVSSALSVMVEPRNHVRNEPLNFTHRAEFNSMPGM